MTNDMKQSIIEEASILMTGHPSKDARWFAKSVYEFFMAEQEDHKDKLIAQLEETVLWQAKRIAELTNPEAQEPVAWQRRTRLRETVRTFPQQSVWTDWFPCTEQAAQEFANSKDEQWEYEVRTLYTAPQPAKREPLTDEEFLRLLLKTGTTELVGWATFVGESIQMKGRIGLLRGAKLLKEFVEAAHGITKE